MSSSSISVAAPCSSSSSAVPCSSSTCCPSSSPATSAQEAAIRRAAALRSAAKSYLAQVPTQFVPDPKTSGPLDFSRIEKCLNAFFTAYPAAELLENAQLFEKERVYLFVNEQQENGTTVRAQIYTLPPRNRFNADLDWSKAPEEQNAVPRLIEHFCALAKSDAKQLHVTMYCENVFHDEIYAVKPQQMFFLGVQEIKQMPSVVKLAKSLDCLIEVKFGCRQDMPRIEFDFSTKSNANNDADGYPATRLNLVLMDSIPCFRPFAAAAVSRAFDVIEK